MHPLAQLPIDEKLPFFDILNFVQKQRYMGVIMPNYIIQINTVRIFIFHKIVFDVILVNLRFPIVIVDKQWWGMNLCRAEWA